MPTNLYGPGDNFSPTGSHVLPAMIRRYDEAVRHGDTEITNWGSGSPRREFLHADDLASACLFLLEHYDGPQQVNVGVGEDVTIAELAELVAAATGFDGTTHWDASKPDGTPASSWTSPTCVRWAGTRPSTCPRGSTTPCPGTARTGTPRGAPSGSPRARGTAGGPHGAARRAALTTAGLRLAAPAGVRCHGREPGRGAPRVHPHHQTEHGHGQQQRGGDVREPVVAQVEAAERDDRNDRGPGCDHPPAGGRTGRGRPVRRRRHRARGLQQVLGVRTEVHEVQQHQHERGGGQRVAGGERVGQVRTHEHVRHGGRPRPATDLMPTMHATATATAPASRTGRHQCWLPSSHTATVTAQMMIIPVGAVRVVTTSRTPVSTGSRCSVSHVRAGTSQRERSSRSVHQSHTRTNSTRLATTMTIAITTRLRRDRASARGGSLSRSRRNPARPGAEVALLWRPWARISSCGQATCRGGENAGGTVREPRASTSRAPPRRAPRTARRSATARPCR